MRSFAYMQEPLDGSKARCSWPLSSLRHATRSLPEEESSQATKYVILLTPNQHDTDTHVEAAIDANAPLEDEEEANGPFDSDEELQGVMNGLANWNPQPLVRPEPQIPIQRKYQKEAIFDQLRQATNGFTINIFAVVGFGHQTLQPGHPGLTMNLDGDADADGEVDGAYGLAAGMQGVASRRASGFNMQQPPNRRTSVASQR